MQISINIESDVVAKKILWFLESLSNEGVSIIKKINNNEETTEFSDEYVEKNWAKIAYEASGDPTKDDDDVLEEEYGKYLYDKHNI
jgi:dolichyl-phosphate-mannose--protein O-mannosyl transferase